MWMRGSELCTHVTSCLQRRVSNTDGSVLAAYIAHLPRTGQPDLAARMHALKHATSAYHEHNTPKPPTATAPLQRTAQLQPVSYTHLTLPTNREV